MVGAKSTFRGQQRSVCSEERVHLAHLDIIPLVIVTTLPKQPMFDNSVHIKYIQDRIGVLEEALGDSATMVTADF